MNPSALYAVHLDKITQPRTNSMLTRFERLVTRWLFRRLLGKSWARMRLEEALAELAATARDTFPEDNDATVAEFLKESLHVGVGRSLPHA